MRLRPYSFVSTLAFAKAKRADALAHGLTQDAAHWKNCQIALERIVNDPGTSSGMGNGLRWGVPLTLDEKEI